MMQFPMQIFLAGDNDNFRICYVSAAAPEPKGTSSFLRSKIRVVAIQLQI
jgi:hypothetical protein